MRQRIIDSTDRQHLGYEFDQEDNPVILPNGMRVFPERIVATQDGFRFISSSYIIDTSEVYT